VIHKQPWYRHCLGEIDKALNMGNRSRKLSDWEKSFLLTVRPRIENDLGLTDKQEDSLRRLYARLTDPVRIFK